MTLPTLRQLQYLVSLQEHQHFGRAATACHVTQSTLSAGLKELEATLGARLVERTRRTTVFTPLGVRVAARAQDLLDQAHELSDLPRAAAAPFGGRLRLGVIPTIAPFLLPRLLPSLKAAYPELEISLHEEMSQAGCEALGQGRRDCLLLAMPYACAGVDHTVLFMDPIRVAVSRSDPLARRRQIAPADLPADRMLLLEDGHCLRDHALDACRRPDIEARAASAASIHTLVQLVSLGLGVSLIPAMAADAGVAAGAGVVIRPLDAPNAERAVALAWRRTSPRRAEYAQFAETLRMLCTRDASVRDAA